MKVRSKLTLVTGAARGIGQALAFGLARHGELQADLARAQEVAARLGY